MIHEFVLLLCISSIAWCRLIDWVDPLIGTGGLGFGCGSDLPGVQVPQGMMRLSPDSESPLYIPQHHFGGYNYNDEWLRCFSCTHTVGAGLSDLGTIGLFAMTKSSDIVWQDLYGYQFKSKFSHQNETSKPGYYQVLLQRYGINVESTATQNAAIQRIRFPDDNSTPYVLFIISHSLAQDSCLDSEINFNEDGSISGWIKFAGDFGSRGYFQKMFGGGVTTYMYAQFGKGVTIEKTAIWKYGSLEYGTYGRGKDIGGLVQLDKDRKEAELFIGISFVSVEQAKINLEQQILNKGWHFDDVRSAAEQEWEAILSQFSVTGEDKSKRIFYTHLYKANTVPTIFSESDGRYIGFDAKVHQAEPGHHFMTDLSIWDIHRTQAPLMAWLRPNISRDMVNSLLEVYRLTGSLPQWPFTYGFGDGMIQYSPVLITDAILKNVPGIDAEYAFQALKDVALNPKPHGGRVGIQEYLSVGYVPSETSDHSACLTLCYAYNDAAISALAGHLGKKEDENAFFNTSKNYKNVWSPNDSIFCPRSKDGSFDCPHGLELINVFDNRYIEGDSWHYNFDVRHDIPGLIDLFGSKEKFLSKLEKFYYYSTWDTSTALPNPYLWIGNEEDLMAPWISGFADGWNSTWLSQLYSKSWKDTYYQTQPDSIPGNNDYGTMSSWLIWSYLGLYPISGTTMYMITSPSLEKVEITISDHCTVRFISHGHGTNNIYCRRAAVDGKNLPQPFIQHQDLVCSPGKTIKTIEFWMSNQKN